MKKTLLYIAASLTLLLTLGACTRNHGDIGIWFGTWHVENISGADSDAPDGDYFFQFQSKVFRVSCVGDHEEVIESYGTWDESEDGNTLTISFPDPTVHYVHMPGLETVNHFTITRKSSREVTFTKTDMLGDNYTYHLKKQP